jgi:UDP-glucose 4-epimerase
VSVLKQVTTGSHVVHVLQSTRQYKVISIDNYHNSQAAALKRVEQLARESLPEDPSDLDIESTKVDAFTCDLTDEDAVRKVFEHYGKGGIWGVIHIAVR